MNRPIITVVLPPDIDDYLTHLRSGGRSPQTIELRRYQLTRFDSWLKGSVRGATVDDLARWLGGRGWSPATIYSNRSGLRNFYDWMVATGRIRRSPAEGLATVKVPRKEPRPAPDTVIHPAGASDRVQLMVDLGAREGLRRAEVAAVHSRDLVRDAAGWSLVIHGKGGRERSVPLHEDIASRILNHGPGWLFPNGSGGHLSPGRVGVLMKDGLGGWTPHSLRRRFATTILDGGGDIRSIQTLLGHSSLSSTERYLGTRPDRLRDAVALT